jgi:hypothetical protein
MDMARGNTVVLVGAACLALAGCGASGGAGRAGSPGGAGSAGGAGGTRSAGAGPGGSGGPAAQSQSPSAADVSAHAPQAPAWLARGNALCAAQARRLQGRAHPSTPEQTIAYLPAALSAMHDDVAGLEALGAGRPGHTKLAAAIASMRQLEGLLRHFLSELRDGMVGFTELGQIQRQSAALHAQLDARFRAAGLPSCAV